MKVMCAVRGASASSAYLPNVSLAFCMIRQNERSARSTRVASHAGSWYTDRADTLADSLQTWLNEVPLRTVPPRVVKAIIGPHAGYSYSGPTAAHAYAHIDANSVDTVFVLGPSHHVYLDTCALSGCIEYETPLGNLAINQQINSELLSSKLFTTMSTEVDEDEHSIEMHLPYIKQVMSSKTNGPFTIVPILVGSLANAKQAQFANILAPYFLASNVLFVVSSDFCHWGTRFSYTPRSSADIPIHRHIESLDREGMGLIERMDCAGFGTYLARTKNTICGRHPIALLLQTLSVARERGATVYRMEFTQYAQSSKVVSPRDSSMVPQAPGLARPFSTFATDATTRAALVADGVRNSHDVNDLANQGNEHARKLVKQSGATGFASTSALAALKASRANGGVLGITTGSKAFDAILGGAGLSIGHVTELCGPPALGKSQIGMQLCVNAQFPSSRGGVDGEAVYIGANTVPSFISVTQAKPADTEGSFTVERVAGMALAAIRRHSADGKEGVSETEDEQLDWILARIHVYRIHNHTDQTALIDQLDELVQLNPRVFIPRLLDLPILTAKQIKLIVLDSVAFHLRQGFTDMALRSRILSSSAQVLRKVAARGVCVRFTFLVEISKFAAGRCH
ncbi:hypothetical protein HDU84_004137 [Entophlyctis sp. JEL0112]|nr:hypothetical protein HDU84_004137 [Entophlyctis sp. JEL0112]